MMKLALNLFLDTLLATKLETIVVAKKKKNSKDTRQDFSICQQSIIYIPMKFYPCFMLMQNTQSVSCCM
jgi:hypothetical protein